MKTEFLGPTTDIEVMDRLLRLDGMSIVDAGCNDGALSRSLAQRGARVLALEPNPIQAAQNRQAEPTEGVTFAEAPAQAMPADAGSIDTVIFSRSLHHVPEQLMDQAIAEAVRVLRPESGVLFILEPEMGGQFSQVMKPFHDETQVRAAALAALARTAAPRFESAAEYWFTQTASYDDFDAFRDRILGHSFNDIAAADIDQPLVRALFEAGRADDGYRLTNPMRVRLYRGPHVPS